MENHPNKDEIKDRLLQLLAAQLKELEMELLELKASKATDTKSSAGDKFETGRETMGQTQQMLETQKGNLKGMSQDLEKIPVSPSETISAGALLQLSIGWIWVGIPYGKVKIGDWEVQAVSSNAPIVKTLRDKKIGEEISLANKVIRLHGIF
ncbi:hypothetical protein [Pleomorphovibrio marinus]|uniref:hypothetical protein n=1 Tax=Pleomorphovibrio marinus TaxID=2164132 RepID=UPI000E0A7C67|nr:hypothetical protein [Pleomorphovibrio marinus]